MYYIILFKPMPETQNYNTLNLKQEDGIVWATFEHPPINLLDINMIREIDVLSRELARDTESRVLARAVGWHLDHRIFLNGSKTVVFS